AFVMLLAWNCSTSHQIRSATVSCFVAVIEKRACEIERAYVGCDIARICYHTLAYDQNQERLYGDRSSGQSADPARAGYAPLPSDARPVTCPRPARGNSRRTAWQSLVRCAASGQQQANRQAPFSRYSDHARCL